MTLYPAEPGRISIRGTFDLRRARRKIKNANGHLANGGHAPKRDRIEATFGSYVSFRFRYLGNPLSLNQTTQAGS